MDRVCLAVLLCLGAFGAVCQAQTLKAEISMNGVKATATFNQTPGGGLSMVIQLNTGQEYFDVTTTVDILPRWVPPEMMCNNLGMALISKTLPVGFSGPSATFSLGNMVVLEGYSVRLSSTKSRVCGTVERMGPYMTAVATFRSAVFGTVHFRQSSETAGLPTRIMSSLQTSENFSTAMWMIVDSMSKCNSAANSQSVFNPYDVDGSQCMPSDLSKCAVGALSQKFGNVSLEAPPVFAMMADTDTNLPLTGANSVQNKVLALLAEGNQVYCAEIQLYKAQHSHVEFSESGVHGYIMFSQMSPLDATETVINITGLQNLAGGYHVHKWPKPVQITSSMTPCSAEYVSGHLNPYNIDVNVGYPAPTVSTDDMYETGDLSSKYGTMQGKMELSGTFKDWNLPLFGENSITGRSVVIHKSDASKSRWICANIEPVDDVVVAIATFKHPVIGHVIFTQKKDEPQSETTIFSQLDYLYGGTPTENKWKVNTNKINGDMLSDAIQTRCESTEPIYNPTGLYSGTAEAVYNQRCMPDSPLHCKMGDLSGKHGLISIRSMGTTEKAAEDFYTDSNLPLSGMKSIIGKSLVIMDNTGTNILACANILPLHGVELHATFSQGSVAFMQRPGYGARETDVKNNLSGLSYDYSLRVYERPPASGDNPCNDLGDVYNPLQATAPTSGSMGTDFQYPVGDLTRFGMQSSWSSQNLPLSGVTSIMGRSLAIVDAAGTIKDCTILLPAVTSAGLPQTAKITFTEGVMGTATMYQMLYKDGSMSDTTIMLDVMNSAARTETKNHNWHVHKMPIDRETDAVNGTCVSALGHFDPYDAIANKPIYTAECGMVMPLHCEVGDQANKLGTYDIGGGRAVFNDVDLPLDGEFSVLGRSLVFHVKDRGAPRLGCADIIPSSADPIDVEFKTPTTINKREGAITYANAIQAPQEDVVLEIVSQSGDNTKAKVHFGGLQREVYRARFSTFLQKSTNRVKLGDYAPLYDPNSAGKLALTLTSSFLMVLILSVHTILM